MGTAFTRVKTLVPNMPTFGRTACQVFFFFFGGFQILVFTADKLRPKLNTELELGVEQQVGSSPSTQKGYGFESSKKQYQVSGMIQASLEHEVHY